LPPTIAPRQSFRSRLLAGASLSATTVFLLTVHSASAANGFGTPGWFAAAQAQRTNALASRSAQLPSASSGVPAPLDAVAQQLASRSIADLTRAAQAVTRAQANQITARTAAAAQASSIADGLTKGGLQVAPGVSGDPSLWQNARAPVQSTSKGKTTVEIQQTAQRAILTWKTFNVGKNTTVDFNQSAGTDSSGNNDWVALNRIVDPSLAPSQILGSIKADGAVYLIDRNGILFGGSSQVNVHTLIASSLDIGQDGQTLAQRNAQFLNLGLNIESYAKLGPESGPAGVSADAFSSYSPFSATPEGGVTVAAGAQITTSVFSPDNPGTVILLGPQVSNSGTIAAPAGQVILAATRAVAFYDNTTASSDPYSPYIGLVPVTNPSLILNNAPDVPFPEPDYFAGAKAVNNGLILARRGNITMQATSITNGGVLEATTSISRNGSIVLNGVTDTNFSPGAVAAILPDENGESIPQGQISSATFTAPYIQIDAAGTAHPSDDGLNGAVTLGANAAIVAPAANVSVYGAARVYVEDGALIDVAGLTTATLPLSDTILNITLNGPELADSPLQRDGVLRGATVTVDTQETGVRSDGLSWIGSPLIDNVASYAAQVPVTIDQLLSSGGTVAFATQATPKGAANANAVILRGGSTIDASGGFLTVPGGMVATTQLLGSDGRIHDIANADPNMTYVGVAGQTTVNHPRWGVTNTYTNPLETGAHYQASYIDGLDAGGVTFASSTVIADGTLLSSAAAGAQQRQAAAVGTAHSTNTDDTRALQANYGQLPVGGYVVFDPSANGLAMLNRYIWLNLGLNNPGNTAPSSAYYLIQADGGSLPAGFGAASALAVPTSTQSSPQAGNRVDTVLISTKIFDDAGFSQITLNSDPNAPGTAIYEAAGANLSVADGGALSLSAGQVTIDGSLTARSGIIDLTSNGPGDPTAPPGTPSIVIGPGAVLNTRGRWTNDTSEDANSAVGPAYTNGGSIALISKARLAQSPMDTSVTVDTTGGILVDPTATLDLTGGGYVNQAGDIQTASGVPTGRGGNLTIETYAGGYPNSGIGTSPTQDLFAATVSIDMAHSVKAYGFAGGGVFTLSTGSAIDIAEGQNGQPTTIDDISTTGALTVPSQFFSTANPFGTIDLESDFGGIAVAPGTHIVLRQSNLQVTAATYALQTGGDVYSATKLGLTPVYQRKPVNLTLGTGAGDVWHYQNLPAGAGDVVIGQGARIDADPRAAISINGAVGVQLLGAIQAPGGTVNIAANFLGANSTVQVGGQTVAVDSIYLGPSSAIAVNGTTLIDTTNARYRSGTVLSGGDVSLRAGQLGYVALSAGSTVDLDGAAGTLQFATANGSGPAYESETVASNAGALTIGASTVIGAADVLASGGGPAASNGSLIVAPDSSSVGAIVLERDSRLPKDFAPGAVLAADLTNNIYLSVQKIDSTHFDDIDLGVYNTLTGTGGVNRIVFAGRETLSARHSITFAGPITVAPKAGDPAPHVTVDAAYLTFGPVLSDSSALPSGAHGSFTANAQSILLESGWIDANVTTLTAAQDVQLVSPISLSTPSDPIVYNGGLVTTGDMTIAAADIYPEGGATGVLQSHPGHRQAGRITLLSNGTSSVPLTAGGNLYVLASDIEQNGTLRAPGGSIHFGLERAAVTAASDPTVGLIAADTLRFGGGSITSVSLDGSVLPYGGTVDGQSWYYNDPTRAGSPLTAPPSKAISLNAASVDVGQGATIDISGGGDLYATEFVPGNGGNRNVLSPTNAYSATSSTVTVFGNAVPQVFAILPANKAGIAPNDIDFATSQGAVAPPAGLSVTLSGVPGLPAGTYLLLPAQYATLPGAYRVVVQSGQTNFQPSQNTVLADGTAVVSGRFTQPAAGEASGTTLAFEVQSSAVWRQYSEIDQTGANTFFAGAAAQAGTAAPRLPTDAGQIVIAASQSLVLSGKLQSNVPAGSLGSQVDITAQDIQILAPGETADKGYLGIDASQLNEFGADSLLIGGVRSQGADGTVITATAYNVDVSTDAAHPLVGPDIVLVARTDPKHADANGALGVRVDAGAVVEASGAASASTRGTITIGHLHGGASDPLGSVSGDGALLAVSTGAPISVVRQNVPGQDGVAGSPLGALTIGAGARIAGGNALLIDASEAVDIADSAHISGTNVALASSGIAVGSAPAGTKGLVLSPMLLKQLSSSHTVTLQSSGAVSFYGNAGITLTSADSVLSVDSGSLVGHDGTVALAASTILLENTQGAPSAATKQGAGTLDLSAREIDLGSGTVGVGGFAAANLSATGRVAGVGVGAVDFGGAALSVVTPQIVAGTGSNESLGTTGAFTASTGSTASTADGSGALGGVLAIKGGSVALDTAILSPSGTITLEAATGDVRLGSQSAVDVSGYAQTFFDVVKYAGGGTVKLISDRGAITQQTGSVIDVSGSSQGGDAGVLSISATSNAGVVTLAGSLKAKSVGGLGGALSIDSGKAISLDSLTASLDGAGFTQSVTIRARAGNLSLSGALAASTVDLVADAGAIVITGTIDASGGAGGQIGLFGRNGVDVEGKLIARGSNAAEAGGAVQIETGALATNGINATYGFENVTQAGPLTIGAHALIDVSGGTVAGLTGGSVELSVPLLESGQVNVAVASGASIVGAHDVTLDANATWKTSDPGSGPTHFDGIIDPAGWYGSNGQPLATNSAGNAIAPSLTNSNHTGFYQTTLIGFVQDDFNVQAPAALAGLGNVHVQPGVTLINDSATINGGNITVATNWNLGAGGYDAKGNITLFYRTAAGEPGALTLQAVNSVNVSASLTDGFFQTRNTLDPQYQHIMASVYLAAAPGGSSTQGFDVAPLYAPAAPYDSNDAAYQAQVALYYASYGGNLRSGYVGAWEAYLAASETLTRPSHTPQTETPSAPAAPTPSAYGSYGAYIDAYDNFILAYKGYLTAAKAANRACGGCAVYQAPSAPVSPTSFNPGILKDTGTYNPSASAGLYGANGPADTPTATDPNPITSADLFPLIADPAGTIVGADGTHYRALGSWSYTIVSGADLTSADPVAVRPLSQFTAATDGSVTVQGHTSYTDKTGISAFLNGRPLTGLVPTTVRTGTGSITIAAANDFALTSLSDLPAAVQNSTDPAPGTVYTGGRTSAPLQDPGYVSVNGGAAINGQNSAAELDGAGNGSGSTTVTNGNGFATPTVGDGYASFVKSEAPVTMPAYPEAGGAVTISAQHDIIGVESTLDSTGKYTGVNGTPMAQFWSQWLLTQSAAAPDLSSLNTSNFNATQGLYDPNAQYSTGQTGAQTSWWINFGSFDQGVAALGGGNVTITAGHNIQDFSASAPTTGRVSGGLKVKNPDGTFTVTTPKLLITGGGNLTVTAGNDILSGSYYVARGTGRIAAGDAIKATGWTYGALNPISFTSIEVAPSTVLAVGDAQLTVTARGAVDIAAIVNPTYLTGAQIAVGDDVIAKNGGAADITLGSGGTPSFVDTASINTYSQASAVTIASLTDNVLLDSLPAYPASTFGIGSSLNQLFAEPNRLAPATVDVTAFRGDITVANGFDQANSNSGTLNLLAFGNLNVSDSPGSSLTGSVNPPTSSTHAGGPAIATYQEVNVQTVDTQSPIPGLINSAFDPSNPDNGFDGGTSGSVLLHQHDPNPIHLYALNGNITNGPSPAALQAGTASSEPLLILASKPVFARAGRDIENLMLYGQNVTASEVTLISAGLDIVYNLRANPNLPISLASNVIQIAGPGDLIVSAGRNLGPFATDFNGVSLSGVATSGNVAWNAGYEDPLLPVGGASIDMFAGVGPGVDYQAVIQTYINPANARSAPHNYLPELAAYLASIGQGDNLSPGEAWAKFQKLDAATQTRFVDQIFFDEIKATQTSGSKVSYKRGYDIINTMFPGAAGYTSNNLSGGTNGANKTVHTGNLDLRSSTIQTRQGGNIAVFVPGGNILLGSTVSRAIYNQPGETGILTFRGGDVDVFADGNVTVNQSRILTEEGGDVVAWSSNGDILAGIGAKTSAAYPPYTVLFDVDGNQTLNPAGLVTGAGIGALLTIPNQDPSKSGAYLIAPRGTIDAGDAGIRVGGNLFVSAVTVANAGNIQVGGRSQGVPVAAAPAIPSAAANAAEAGTSQGAEDAANRASSRLAGNDNPLPSLITVDVLGFGDDPSDEACRDTGKTGGKPGC
jgi:filamentous hemagglutinin family protein